MEVTRIFDILEYAKINFAHKDDLLASKENGTWKKYSIKDYIENANNFSYGLLSMGFKRGDKIVTVSNNRPEWNFADMGMSQIGVVNVPVYSTLSNDEFKYIFQHSEAKIVIVSGRNLYLKLSSVVDEMPDIKALYTFDVVPNVKNWTEIIEVGKSKAKDYTTELIKRRQAIKPSDLATIIYTSGTTGVSKGVMLSHNNIISNVKATVKLNFLHSNNRILDFLPLSHVFARMVNLVYQYLGVSIYYAESLATLADNIKELKVDGFIVVPRVLESMFDKFLAKGKELKGIKHLIFDWAIKLGYNYKAQGENSWFYKQVLKIFDKLVYSKLREALGGNIIFIASGGASLQTRLEKIFWAAKIPVYQGYGLTETSPIIAVNYKGQTIDANVKFGTVGPLLGDVKIKIADDGEILCKGSCVMMGYYRNPEMTAEVIDSDGWFHTGDIGELDEKGFLKITDRKKEIFKMSSGKYIAPQRIENIMKESFFIEQLMVVGENQKYAGAIISPNFNFLHDWCFRHKIQFDNNNELINKPEIIERFKSEVSKLNRNLGETERIKKFKLVPEEWSPLTGELSPTLKLKRKYIYSKYNSLVETMYPVNGNNNLD
jgi:long-chain acyl-CoA synthetase